MAWLPGAAAVMAFVACNGMVLLVASLSVFGISVVINPHIQAAVISLFSVLTLGFVFAVFRKHHALMPLLLCGVGATLIVGTMYVAYSKLVESLGLLLLIVSAVWSWRVTQKKGSASVSDEGA